MKFIRIFILLTFFLINSENIFSQYLLIHKNIGIGYNLGTHLNTDGLDFVIGRFNDTRPYLGKNMKEPGIFRGINFAIELFDTNCVFNLEWVGRKSEVFAQSPDSIGANTRIDLKYAVNSLNLGYGYKMNHKKSGIMGFYTGIDLSCIFINTDTRTYSTSVSASKYTKIKTHFQIGFSPFFQYVHDRFTTKIYYQLMIFKVYYSNENQKLNPDTWMADDKYKNNGKTSSLGISVRYNLFKNN